MREIHTNELRDNWTSGESWRSPSGRYWWINGSQCRQGDDWEKEYELLIGEPGVGAAADETIGDLDRGGVRRVGMDGGHGSLERLRARAMEIDSGGTENGELDR